MYSYDGIDFRTLGPGIPSSLCMAGRPGEGQGKGPKFPAEDNDAAGHLITAVAVSGWSALSL